MTSDAVRIITFPLRQIGKREDLQIGGGDCERGTTNAPTTSDDISSGAKAMLSETSANALHQPPERWRESLRAFVDGSSDPAWEEVAGPRRSGALLPLTSATGSSTATSADAGRNANHGLLHDTP